MMTAMVLALRLGNPIGRTTQVPNDSALNDYINALYPTLMEIAAVSAVLMIIYGGYRYIVSEGDPTKLGEAKNTLMGAGTGLILIIIIVLIVDMFKTG